VSGVKWRGRGPWPLGQCLSLTNNPVLEADPISSSSETGLGRPHRHRAVLKHWQASFNSPFPLHIFFVSFCLPPRAYLVPPWTRTTSLAVNGSGQRDWTCLSRRIGLQGRHHQHSVIPTNLQTPPTTRQILPIPSTFLTRNPNDQRDEPTSLERVESASRSCPRPPKLTNRSRRGSLHRRPVSNSSRKTRNSVAWSARVCARAVRNTFTRDVSRHGDRLRPCRTGTFGNARRASSSTD